jgi:hypothetical protein
MLFGLTNHIGIVHTDFTCSVPINWLICNSYNQDGLGLDLFIGKSLWTAFVYNIRQPTILFKVVSDYTVIAILASLVNSDHNHLPLIVSHLGDYSSQLVLLSTALILLYFTSLY